jgi:CheY-like chemotaxis protein
MADTAKILLAEDDTDMRRFLVKALQNAGFDVISYDNGLSAYQRLREEPFQLLLTDIVMPEMDGIELARRAAELDPDIKIAGPQASQGAVQADPSARPRQRGPEDAGGGLIRSWAASGRPVVTVGDGFGWSWTVLAPACLSSRHPIRRCLPEGMGA